MARGQRFNRLMKGNHKGTGAKRGRKGINPKMHRVKQRGGSR